MKFVDFNQVKNLGLSAQEMYNWTCDVWRLQDTFILPAKTKMWQGESGRYITMPCCMPDQDIAGVKFISRNVDDVNGLPARNSNIMLQRISEHGLYAVLDGTYITTMRTGACAYYNAVILKDWKAYNGSVGAVSYFKEDGKDTGETAAVTLIPYGCTTLRICCFPTRR